MPGRGYDFDPYGARSCKWLIRAGGVLLFGASERPLNHPGAALDDPIMPMLEDGAHWDGRIPAFYVKWQYLTIPMYSILDHGHYRIVQIGHRGLSKAPKSNLPPDEFGDLARSGTIWVKIVPYGHHMGNSFQKWCCGLGQ